MNGNGIVKSGLKDKQIDLTSANKSPSHVGPVSRWSVQQPCNSQCACRTETPGRKPQSTGEGAPHHYLFAPLYTVEGRQRIGCRFVTYLPTTYYTVRGEAKGWGDKINGSLSSLHHNPCTNIESFVLTPFARRPDTGWRVVARTHVGEVLLVL